jgi:hypothetical protein
MITADKIKAPDRLVQDDRLADDPEANGIYGQIL